MTGGVTPKNIHFIEGQNSCFMTAYKDKGRVSHLLDRIPLFAVLTEDLGVRGALKAASMVSTQCIVLNDHPIHCMLTDYGSVKEYEKLHEIEVMGGQYKGSNKTRNANPGYGPLMLVATTMISMTVGALISRAMNKKS